LEWERGPVIWRDGLMPGGAKGRDALVRIQADEGVAEGIL